MAKTRLNESFSLGYTSRDEATNDSQGDISLNFDNPKDDSVIVTKLNTWLKAIGRENVVVELKGGK